MTPKPSGPKREEKRRRAGRIFRALARLYPRAHCELDFRTPFQLLVATILSAQCTDQNVNRVTPALFASFPDALSMSRADPERLQGLIRSIGLFRAKARNLLACSRALVERHGGEVPDRMEDLVELAGVGRKTANVVLFNAFGKPGLPVDTHVLRVGKRLGLFRSQNPLQVEKELGGLVPPETWGMVSHWLIWHGRRVCKARNPACQACSLRGLCDFGSKA